MFGMLLRLAVVVGLAYGAVTVARDAELRGQATRRVVAVLDDILGVKTKEPKVAKVVEVAPKVVQTKAEPPKPRPKVDEQPKVVTGYVDRSPNPSTFDRIPAADQKRLDNLVARRLGPAAAR